MTDFGGRTFSSSPSSAPKKAGLLSRLPSYTLIYLPSESGASRRISIPKAVVFVAVLGIFALCGAVAALGVTCLRMREMVFEYERLRAENHSIRSEAAALVAKLQEVQSNLKQVDSISDQVRDIAMDVKVPGSPINDKSAAAAKKKNALPPSATPALRAKGLPHKAGKTKPSHPAAEPAAGELSPSKDAASAPTKKQGRLAPGMLPPAIGPLTEEEYALSQKQAAGSEELPANVKFESLEFRDLFTQLSDIKDKSSTQLQTLEALLGELQEYRTRLAATPTISPVKGWITSMFGWRSSPFTGNARMHQGLDIAAPMGTPIRSAADGTITKVAMAEDYGNYVEVTHGYGVVSRYAHASKITVKVGTQVKKGDIIGNVGMTGRTTGPHLHYELVIHGRKVDPSNFIR